MEIADSYRDLKVWQKAIDLSVALYKLTEKFPNNEIYGVTSQLRRGEFPPQAISPRGLDEDRQRTKSGFLGWPVERILKYKPSW